MGGAEGFTTLMSVFGGVGRDCQNLFSPHIFKVVSYSWTISVGRVWGEEVK